MRDPLLIGIPLLALTILVGAAIRVPCCTERIQVAEETLAQANRAGFDYMSKYRAARGGSTHAIGEFIVFGERTDAAGALGHGVSLVEVLQIVGDQRFAECVRQQPEAQRVRLRQLLEAGVDYGMHRDPRDLDSCFPLTSAAIRVPRIR